MGIAIAALGLAGCQSASPVAQKNPPAIATVTSVNPPVAAVKPSTDGQAQVAKRYAYTPRPYPVDERGFSPVDKALAKAYAREEMVTDDAEGSLNPYVIKVFRHFRRMVPIRTIAVGRLANTTFTTA